MERAGRSRTGTPGRVTAGASVRIAASPLTVAPVLAVCLTLAVPVFPELWAAVRSPHLDGFRELTALANGAGAIWAQVIAWDLLLVMGPLLVLTILLSPFGLLVLRPRSGTGDAAHQSAGAPATNVG
ncbi:hypothetical protein NLX86_03215 [Streptomyces sp. A3M-1-3]|uniref:abscisic acid-deficient protein Aba4 family protein n=1 Tax=Streptomyces sp. A3M-1-3 TaxID=2962044 RepID=UPI0020B73B02|nr:abscisic acid-deficient protein Aba4 family protein [Streptomyces sp. A3M-1-3]MCP3817182.1 hypothetical protein [Streptomyces sp. A3M-1-3]